jgi:hypothetical protein
MAVRQRTRDATVLWLRDRSALAAVAAPAVFAWYMLRPLAAVRALSDARHEEESCTRLLPHDLVGDSPQGDGETCSGSITWGVGDPLRPRSADRGPKGLR